MSAYTYAILSVLLVSIISLVGIFTLAIDTKKIQKYTFVLVSLAVGAVMRSKSGAEGATFGHS
jgi:hypothetical protein